MFWESSLPDTAVCEITSVQQESRFGVLKNRPLPSTVIVTLLGNPAAGPPDIRLGTAIMIASRSPLTSPANRIRTPCPSGRSILSQIISEPDQLTVVSKLPNNTVCRAPFSPQPEPTSAGGGAGCSTAAGSQAPKVLNRSKPSTGSFCAETGFFSG